MEIDLPTNKDNAFNSHILYHLILNGSFLKELGLFHGKIGIAIFFAYYSRFSAKSYYNEFAFELLNEIYEEVHLNMPINLESGLAGIAWGITHLIQYNFMKGDPNKILNEIDQKIMEFDFKRISDLSLHTGLEGISFYIYKRISFCKQQQVKLPFDREFLSDWKKIVPNISNFSDNKLISYLVFSKAKGKDITTYPLGLYRGCAGIGLKHILL